MLIQDFSNPHSHQTSAHKHPRKENLSAEKYVTPEGNLRRTKHSARREPFKNVAQNLRDAQTQLNRQKEQAFRASRKVQHRSTGFGGAKMSITELGSGLSSIDRVPMSSISI